MVLPKFELPPSPHLRLWNELSGALGIGAIGIGIWDRLILGGQTWNLPKFGGQLTPSLIHLWPVAIKWRRQIGCD